jgi:hypothetical protein
MDLSATIVIERVPRDVYAFVADPSNDVHWRSGVTDSGLSTPLPLGVGSEGYVRVGDTEARWRVVGFTEGSSVDWELLSGPIRGTGGYRIEPDGEHTRFTLRADVEPRGAMRLLRPLVKRMGMRQNQADVERLKQLLEARGDA